MTTATIALGELAEKGADIDVLRQMVQFMAQRLMELDVDGRCGAGYDEKSPERTNSRNGYRDRAWDTRAGTVALKIPKLRSGSYFPEFLEPRRTAEKALTAVALVFAIFQLNPAPFCLLDEVDAPLDDANVIRYCETLKTLSDKTQLVYITHNKISMEMADILIGVTMSEPGVSRLVAVDVDQAMEMVAQ